MLVAMKMTTGTETKPVSGTRVRAETTTTTVNLTRSNQMTGVMINVKTKFHV